MVATGTTVSITGGDAGFEQRLVGNALFGNAPFGGTQVDNTTSAHGDADTYSVNPGGGLTGASNRLDLYPLAALAGPVDTSGLSSYTDWNVDFNATPRSTSYRGAYVGGGSNPGWLPAIERKPESAIFADGFESGNTSAWAVAAPTQPAQLQIP